MQTTWMYRSELGLSDEDLAGYDVEATDGSIGSIDESTTDRDHLIVDTGFWIFGKKRLLPAGVVQRVDHHNKKVHVNMTKEQIKDAPDLDEQVDYNGSEWDRSMYVTYYGPYTRW